MNIKILEATDNPDELMVRAARNDYGADATAPLHEVIETIEPEEEDREWSKKFLQEHGNDFDSIVELWAKKRKLIRKLFNRGHFGVSEHPTITFSIRGVSRSLMAQLTRHRNASFDIMSMRYVEVEEPDVYEFPGIDDSSPTGRGAEYDEAVEEWDDEHIEEKRRVEFETSVNESFTTYQELLDMGVAPEHARMVLPIGTKVNIVMTVNVRSLLHIADMRAAGDAQKEIREMTEELLDLAEEWCPVAIGVYRENLQGRPNRLSP